jgi:hypothetical protein
MSPVAADDRLFLMAMESCLSVSRPLYLCLSVCV